MILKDDISKGSRDFISGNLSPKVTILPFLVAIEIVAVKK